MQAAGTAILIGSEVVVAALIATYLLLRRKSLAGPELNTFAAGVERSTSQAETENTSSDGRMSRGEVAPSALENTPAPQGKTAADLAADCFGLSPREADVLRLLVAGKPTAQIQNELCIAPGTFNYHMRNIYSKFGVHSRQELLASIYNQQEQRKQ